MTSLRYILFAPLLRFSTTGEKKLFSRPGYSLLSWGENCNVKFDEEKEVDRVRSKRNLEMINIPLRLDKNFRGLLISFLSLFAFIDG